MKYGKLIFGAAFVFSQAQPMFRPVNVRNVKISFSNRINNLDIKRNIRSSKLSSKIEEKYSLSKILSKPAIKKRVSTG